MTDTLSSKSQPLPPAPQARDLSAAALVLSAEAAEISAEAEERDRVRSDASPSPSVSGVRPDTRKAVVRRRHEPIRQPRAMTQSERALVPVNPTALDAARNAAQDLSPKDTRSELRDWIKDNATLLSNASLLISLAAVALSLLPDVGVFSPYLKALIFAAALLL